MAITRGASTPKNGKQSTVIDSSCGVVLNHQWHEGAQLHSEISEESRYPCHEWRIQGISPKP